MRILLPGVFGWIVCIGLLGCVNPCEDLADRRCERLGESSKACEDLRAEATNASLEMRSECHTALQMAGTLSKNR